MPGMCFAFQKGECERGDSCRFAHSEADVTEPKPRGICYAFQEQKCERGDSCRYLHEAGEVPASASQPREPRERGPRTKSGRGARGPRPSGSRGQCFDFQKGSCERGDSCRFSHGGDDEAKAPRPRGACFAYAKGECERGDSCRFSHEAASA